MTHALPTNQVIEGKQCMIVLHMDDIKILHVNEKVVDDMIDQLNTEFRTQNALTGSSGTSHDYLGI